MAQTNGDSSLTHQGSSLERHIVAVLRACLYVGMVFILIISVVTAFHVIGRYGFHKPVLGLIEISNYCLIVAVFLIGAYIMALKRHVTLGIIVDRFSERAQAIIDSVTYLLCLAFTIVVCWQTFLRAIYEVNSGASSEILRIPNSPFVIVVAIGWALLSIAIIINLVHSFTRMVKK